MVALTLIFSLRMLVVHRGMLGNDCLLLSYLTNVMFVGVVVVFFYLSIKILHKVV